MQRMARIAVAVLVVAAVSSGAAWAGDVAVHGLVSQGYYSSSDYNYLVPDTKAGTMSVNEAIINMTAMVDNKTRIGVQFLGRDFGRNANGNVVLDWAFGDYRWRDAMGFRAGKIKTPLGFYNKTRDVDAVRTSILMPQAVYNEGFREVATAFQGFSAYGDLAIGDNSSLEYEAWYGTVEMDQNQFLATVIAPDGAPQLGYSVETKYWTGAAGTWNTPLEGLRVGTTWGTMHANAAGRYQAGAPVPLEIDLDMKMNHIYVLSAEYLRDNLTLAAELSRMDVDFSVVNNLMPGVATMKDQRGGYYAQGSYRFSDLFEFGSYYSVYYPDWDNKDGEGLPHDYQAWQKDLALTGRFDITGNWILKAEYHFMNGTGHTEPTLNPDGADADTWGMFAAKSTFYF